MSLRLVHCEWLTPNLLHPAFRIKTNERLSACVTSIMRTVTSVHLVGEQDLSFAYFQVLLWSFVSPLSSHQSSSALTVLPNIQRRRNSQRNHMRLHARSRPIY